MSRPDMTIHRYKFDVRHVVEALLADEAGDADDIVITIAGDVLFLDVINPAQIARAVTVGADREDVGSAADTDDSGAGAAVAEAEAEDGADATDEPPKGGPLAQQAGIMCGQKAFWNFMDAASAEEAASELRAACDVASRADLDHHEDAAKKFKRLKIDYENWLRE